MTINIDSMNSKKKYVSLKSEEENNYLKIIDFWNNNYDTIGNVLKKGRSPGFMFLSLKKHNKDKTQVTEETCLLKKIYSDFCTEDDIHLKGWLYESKLSSIQSNLPIVALKNKSDTNLDNITTKFCKAGISVLLYDKIEFHRNENKNDLYSDYYY